MIEVDLNAVSVPLRWQELFADDGPVDVEIGSGKGAFLLDLALQDKDRRFLAVERAPKYHKLTCERAARRGVTNVRLLRTTAEDLFLRLVPPASIARLFVLFPDPWPKKRHHKRRLFKPENVSAMAQALIPGGPLLVKSDHPEYATVIAEALASCSDLEPIDVDAAFADLPLTGFERKYVVEGRPIHAFAMQRKS